MLEPINRLISAVSAVERSITQEAIERAQQATRLLRELLTYAVPAGPDQPREDLEAGRDAFAKFQSAEYAQEIFFSVGEYRRGRPVKRRHVAAVALEAKRRNPRLTRLELARQFCACGEAHHNEECAERLRRDIQRLNALIRRILRDYPA